MNNVYLASGFRQAETLRRLATKIETITLADHKQRYRICSNWIYVLTRPDRERPEWDAFASKIAAMNLIDLHTANTLVVDTRGIAVANNGGVHTELGFGLGKDLPIYLIGQGRNTFMWLPQIIRVADEDELLYLLEARLK